MPFLHFSYIPVNALSIAMGSDDKFSVPKAPTKEELSFSTYTARRRLNRLRRSACHLFTSEVMVKAIQRLELEVEARRLLVRKDRHLWKDIGRRYGRSSQTMLLKPTLHYVTNSPIKILMTQSVEKSEFKYCCKKTYFPGYFTTNLMIFCRYTYLFVIVNLISNPKWQGFPQPCTVKVGDCLSKHLKCI